jgi:hypothetical protein
MDVSREDVDEVVRMWTRRRKVVHRQYSTLVA